jgi:hypothetical protein
MIDFGVFCQATEARGNPLQLQPFRLQPTQPNLQESGMQRPALQLWYTNNFSHTVFIVSFHLIFVLSQATTPTILL